MRETGQRLTSLSRSERLTDDEMKRLARLLATELAVEYVRFSHRAPTVTVELVGYTGPIPPQLADEVAQTIGEYQSRGLPR